MNKLILGVVIALLSLQLPAQNINFDQLEEMIINHNQGMKSQQMLTQSQRSREGELARSFFPEVNLQGGVESYKGEYARDQKGFATVEARLNLLRGGRDALEEKRLQSLTKMSQENYESQKMRYLQQARSYYREIQGLIKQHQLHLEHIKGLSKIQEVGKQRVQKKVALESEVLMIEYEILKHQGLNRQLLLEIDESKTKLSVLLGLAEHKNLSFDKNLPKPKDEWPKDSSSAQAHPEIRALGAQRQILQNHTEQKRAWRQFDLGLYGHYGRPALSAEEDIARENKNEMAVGLRLQFSLGDMMRSRSDKVAHHYELRALEYQQEYLLNEKQAYDHEVRHDLETTHQLWRDNRKRAELAEKIYQKNFESYQRGVISLSEMTQTLNLVHETKINEIELLVSYAQKKAMLDYLNP